MSDNPQLFEVCLDTNNQPLYESQITLRDLFAGFALAGICAGTPLAKDEMRHFEFTEKLAYKMADLMLAERAKEGG